MENLLEEINNKLDLILAHQSYISDPIKERVKELISKPPTVKKPIGMPPRVKSNFIYYITNYPNEVQNEIKLNYLPEGKKFKKDGVLFTKKKIQGLLWKKHKELKDDVFINVMKITEKENNKLIEQMKNYIKNNPKEFNDYLKEKNFNKTLRFCKDKNIKVTL